MLFESHTAESGVATPEQSNAYEFSAEASATQRWQEVLWARLSSFLSASVIGTKHVFIQSTYNLRAGNWTLNAEDSNVPFSLHRIRLLFSWAS